MWAHNDSQVVFRDHMDGLKLFRGLLRNIYLKPKVPLRERLPADHRRLRIPMTLKLLHQEIH